MMLIADGKRREAEHAHADRAWLAWNTAALHRAKRMPPLSDLTTKRKRAPRRKVSSVDQLQTMATMWASATPKKGRGR